MKNEQKKKTEELLEGFKWYTLNYKLLIDMLNNATEKLQDNKQRNNEALGTASVLAHALLEPTNQLMQEELPNLENNLKNIHDDEKDNYLDLVDGMLSTLVALLKLLDDNVVKLHTQMLEGDESND